MIKNKRFKFFKRFINMWEAHVQGKRLLKNLLKTPPVSNGQFDMVTTHEAEDTEISASLLALIMEAKSLEFIKETQGPNGEIYNCFICGSCHTQFDIVRHLSLTKHKINYLEEKNRTAMNPIHMNQIYDSRHETDLQCLKMLKTVGKGKVEVYVAKNTVEGKSGKRCKKCKECSKRSEKLSPSTYPCIRNIASTFISSSKSSSSHQPHPKSSSSPRSSSHHYKSKSSKQTHHRFQYSSAFPTRKRFDTRRSRSYYRPPVCKSTWQQVEVH